MSDVNVVRNSSIEPLISIVTIFRNEIRYLEETLNSIISQSFRDWECILIDGNSSDGSFQLAENYANQDERFRVCVQNSIGISNAFNDGIFQASGKVIVTLNGGDVFAGPNALLTIVNQIKNAPDSICGFRTEYIREDGGRTEIVFPRLSSNVRLFDRFCNFSHQGSAIPISIIRRIGGYSPCLRIAMDYEFWLRAVSAGYSFSSSDAIVTLHRLGGVSYRAKNLGRLESALIRLLYFGFRRRFAVKDLAAVVYSGALSLATKRWNTSYARK